VTSDLDRLASDVRTLSPDDGPIIDELVEGARNLKGVDMNFDISRESKGKGDMLDYFMRYNTPANEFAKRFGNPFLQWCVTSIFIPTMPTAFLFMILGRLENGEMARVEGGSLDFSLRVAKRYRDLGGKVKYGATVEEILVEDDRAVGVRLADGSEHRADIVVSCADGYSTIFKMLGERYIDQKIKDRYANWPMFPPILIISFGVANDFAGEASSNTVRLQRPITLGGKEFEAFAFRIYNDDPTMAPPGKTVVQVTLRTDFDWWCDLQEKDRASYDAEKERVAKDVLAQLECYLPGITSQVEVTDVATPYTFWRYTRNYRGAFEGWLLAPETMGTSVEKTLPGLSNFYMAGQWVEPGGGIPSALFSGRNLMKRLCRQDGKEFSATMP
jgi:phytoene desaturase